MAESAGLTAATAAAELRRLARELDDLSVPQLLDVREGIETLLARERLTAEDARELLDRAGR